MKTETKNKMGKLPAVIRSNKGVETRILIYVLAFIALVAALGVMTGAFSQASQFSSLATLMGSKQMKNQITDSTGAATDPDYADAVTSLNTQIANAQKALKPSP
jgi:hypothetical protein